MYSFGTRASAVSIFVFVLTVGVVWAAPAPQEAGTPGVRRLSDPLDLGINIPQIFDLKLLTGRSGTDLGINIPAILNLHLDRARGRPGGLLLDLFGASGRPRGRSIFRPSEAENLVPDKNA
uniref:Putative secreted protein n=1 Tax=Amblyomma cajennense TaxID=34607 RepID=A0A023FDZ5_AMBCJ